MGKNYRAVSSILRPMVADIVSDNGLCYLEGSIAELLYEKNNLNEAAMKIAGALATQTPELMMATYGLMARIGRVDLGARQPEELLSRLKHVLVEADAQYLMPDFEALITTFDIHAGRIQAVQEWLDTKALDELESCTLAESYQLMTKAQAYAYSVCILPPARKNPATLPVKICHVTGFPCQ